jgi:bifunctional UDP-N-acetylglucosamine pyrophosphorylase / glucosamine-1-phosphate N-acetyltransferase
MSTTNPPAAQGVAVILAAGMGTRMRSRLAKVLHPLLGRSMAAWVVDAARGAGLRSIAVVNHQEDAVRADLSASDVSFVRQPVPRGTGDAVAAATDALPETGPVVVLCGDAPLVRAETLRALLGAHAASPHPVTVLTARVADPGAYGRIIRGEDGAVVAIVEAAEATPAQLAIDEINTGAYAFDAAYLKQMLPRLEPHPPKGEYYLTDLVEFAAEHGGAGGMVHHDLNELMGVNDKWALATARGVLQERILRRHALAGVTFQHPQSTRVEAGVELAQDVVVGPHVVLAGATRVGEGTVISAGCVLTDSVVAEDVLVKPYSVFEQAIVGPRAQIGPYARLRPAADIREGAKVGNFVEIKKAVVEPGAKVPHLSYVGDARVGEKANVGAGTITCNYDGYGKHHTDIGAGAFIGSNSSLVAPVRIGVGALVGAGSVVTQDVPDDALALGRGRQVNMSGAAPQLRARAKARKDAAVARESGSEA